MMILWWSDDTIRQQCEYHKLLVTRRSSALMTCLFRKETVALPEPLRLADYQLPISWQVIGLSLPGCLQSLSRLDILHTDWLTDWPLVTQVKLLRWEQFTHQTRCVQHFPESAFLPNQSEWWFQQLADVETAEWRVGRHWHQLPAVVAGCLLSSQSPAWRVPSVSSLLSRPGKPSSCNLTLLWLLTPSHQ